MFIHQLPTSNNVFSFYYESYAKKHFLKDFIKKYPGKWSFTEESIINDLIRLKIPTNKTQYSMQVDELHYIDNKWIIKYDFSIAGSRMSPKASGNRCIIYIDNDKETMNVLLIYSKTDLPKNKKETVYIEDIIKNEYPQIANIFNL